MPERMIASLVDAARGKRCRVLELSLPYRRDGCTLGRLAEETIGAIHASSSDRSERIVRLEALAVLGWRVMEGSVSSGNPDTQVYAGIGRATVARALEALREEYGDDGEGGDTKRAIDHYLVTSRGAWEDLRDELVGR